MEIIIRRESHKDIDAIYQVNNRAFNQPDEAQLVNKIRKGPNFIPELSLVAELDGKIVGHILFSKIKIVSDSVKHESITLAPMAVDPQYQKLGIGKQLVRAGLEMVKEMGFDAVIVLGHSEYYPKFGFRPASKWNIKCPFKVPDNAFMGIELLPGSLENKEGIVKFPEEFKED